MSDLWQVPRLAQAITGGPLHAAFESTSRKELSEIQNMEPMVTAALEHPKPLEMSMPVFNAVLAAQYLALFEALGLPGALSVYEPCVGASPPVIYAAEAYSGGTGHYCTLNLNRLLREELQAKIGHLQMDIRILEDNAVHSLRHLQPQSFDVACFHHAINDILQTAVAEPRGMDTTQIDWFPNEQEMIEWLAEEDGEHGLEKRGKPELLQIIHDAIRLVRPGGFLIFDHWNWCRYRDVDWFPWELFYQFIPTTRQWIREAGLPVSEVPLPGVDPQWWMVLKVDG